MIILGLDPGSHTTGYAILDAERATVSFVECGSLENEELAAWLYDDAHDVDCVAIERIEGVAFAPKGAGIVPHLLSASNAAGVAKGAAQLLSTNRARVHIVEASAREWRKAIVGKANASDADVKRVVTLHVQGWPKVSNAHERDAAGVAMYAARRVRLEAA